MGKLKDKKVWAPLLGIAALMAGLQTGVGIPEEQVDEAAENVALLAEHAEQLYLGAAAILGGIAAWFGWRK